MLRAGINEEFGLRTPEQKLGSHKHDSPGYTPEAFLSSVSGSSDIYSKEGSEIVYDHRMLNLVHMICLTNP